MNKLSILPVLGMLIFTGATAQESYNVSLTPQAVFSETFSDNGQKWPQYKADTAEILVQNGGYLQKAVLRDVFIPRPAGADLRRSANYYRLRAETKLIEGTGYYGIAFGVKNRGNMNLFLINNAGEYIIREVREGKITDMVKKQSEKINTGPGAVNILAVETANGFLGYQVSYFVNGSNIQGFTKKEQAAYDEKRKNDKNGFSISREAIDEMMAGKVDAQGGGIGLLTKQGATVIFDNFNLQTMPNRGDIIAFNNQWKDDPADRAYLKKPLQLEAKTEETERRNSFAKTEEDRLARARASISALAPDKMVPPGSNGKKFIPDPAAVAELSKMIFDAGESSPFGFQPEKEVVSVKGDVTEYRIRHRLPGISGNAVATVEKNKSAKLFVLLGNNLSEPDARKLYAQYLVNLCAAAGTGIGKYLDPKPAEPALHMVGVSTGGANFISGRKVTPVLLPDQNTDGTWRLRLMMSAE